MSYSLIDSTKNALELWSYINKKKRVLMYNNDYKNIMGDEITMAQVFGYNVSLRDKICSFSTPSERIDIVDIFDGRVSINCENKNLVIREI